MSRYEHPWDADLAPAHFFIHFQFRTVCYHYLIKRYYEAEPLSTTFSDRDMSCILPMGCTMSYVLNYSPWGTDYEDMMARSLILCSPNLSPNPKNIYLGFGYKGLVFCRNNSCLTLSHPGGGGVCTNPPLALSATTLWGMHQPIPKF